MEFGRERDRVDLNKVERTHHNLPTSGKQILTLAAAGEKMQLMTDAGSTSVQDKENALYSKVLQNLNKPFNGDLSVSDQFS